MDSRYMRLLKDTGVFAIGNLGSKIILFLLVPLYTNFMTTEEYGTSDLVFTIAQLIVPFTSLVIFDAVQRFGLSKYEQAENVLLCGFFICGIGSIVALAITPLLGLYSAVSEWRWFLSVYVVLNMFGSVEMNYLKARDKNKLFALFSILQTLALALCNIAFLCWQGLGIMGYLLSTCLASLIPVLCPMVFGGIFSDLRKARFDAGLLKRMCAYSTPLILNNVSWWAIHSADKVMVEFFLGTAALGIFTVATKIPSLINVMVNIFSQAWGISAVKEIESTNDLRFYSNVLEVYQLFAFGASVVLVAIIRPFMNVYVGADFGDSWRYVPLMLTAASFSAIAAYFGSIYGALLKSFNNMVTTFIAAVVNVAVGVALIPTFGLWGAVISVFASYAALFVARMVDVRRYLAIDFGGWRFCVNAGVATIQAVLVSAEFFPVLVSCIACMLMLAVNYKTLKTIFERLINR